jgi:hypothetical protein
MCILFCMRTYSVLKTNILRSNSVSPELYCITFTVHVVQEQHKVTIRPGFSGTVPEIRLMSLICPHFLYSSDFILSS